MNKTAEKKAKKLVKIGALKARKTVLSEELGRMDERRETWDNADVEYAHELQEEITELQHEINRVEKEE